MPDPHVASPQQPPWEVLDLCCLNCTNNVRRSLVERLMNLGGTLRQVEKFALFLPLLPEDEDRVNLGCGGDFHSTHSCWGCKG